MSSPITLDRHANPVGACGMVVPMAAFAVEDTVLKTATAVSPLGQVLVLFGFGGALVFAVLVRTRGERFYTRDVISPAMLIRLGFEITGRLFFVLAISLSPLSATTAIMQATPIAAVAGAALVLGEKVGLGR